MARKHFYYFVFRLKYINFANKIQYLKTYHTWKI